MFSFGCRRRYLNVSNTRGGQTQEKIKRLSRTRDRLVRQAVRFFDENACLCECCFERVRVILGAAGYAPVVDKCCRTRLSLADVNVRVGEFMLFEPFDHANAKLAGRDDRTLENVLRTSG